MRVEYQTQGSHIHVAVIESCLVEEPSGHRVSEQATSLPELFVRWLHKVMIRHCNL